MRKQCGRSEGHFCDSGQIFRPVHYYCQQSPVVDQDQEKLPVNIQWEVGRIKREKHHDPVAAAEHIVRIITANPTMAEEILTALGD